MYVTIIENLGHYMTTSFIADTEYEKDQFEINLHFEMQIILNNDIKFNF